MFKKSFLIAFVLTGFVQAALPPAPRFTTPPGRVQTVRASATNNLPMTRAERQARDTQLRLLDEQRKANQEAARAAARASAINNLPMPLFAIQARDAELRRLDDQRGINQNIERAAARL